jgi:hypothetical protein
MQPGPGARLLPGTAFGATLAAQWPGPVGLEVSFATAATTRRVSQPSSTAPARTTVVGFGVTLNQSIGSRSALRLGAGIAVTSLAGAGYDAAPLTNQQRLGPRFSARFTTQLNQVTHAELGVANALYSVAFTDELRPSPTTQNDLVISAGIGLKVGN